MKVIKRLLPAVCATLLAAPQVQAGNGEVTLIHMGDIHGHMVPRDNVRSDTTGRLEGGLARMYTKVKQLRNDATYRALFAKAF